MDALLVVELCAILLGAEVLGVVRHAGNEPLFKSWTRDSIPLKADHLARHLLASVRVDFNLGRSVDLEGRHVHSVWLAFTDSLDVEVVL